MQNNNKNIAIVVPTLNAGSLWFDWLTALKNQTANIHTTLVIDSGSTDRTKELAIKNGFKLHEISKADFDHGATRQLALSLLKNIDIVVYLTQDAILAEANALQELLAAFGENAIGAAYGRQIPRHNANAIEAHGRIFNYPEKSCVKSIGDLERYGFNLIFISNAFAAYRIAALTDAGGFPANIILGEDTYTCAKLLKTGWKIAYQSKAKVIHSHRYGILEEASRYFDTGVLHAREQWLLDEFGGTNSQGIKFVKSELLYLLRNNPLNIPAALLRNFFKYLFYKLGRIEKKLPLPLKKSLSMNKKFWC